MKTSKKNWHRQTSAATKRLALLMAGLAPMAAYSAEIVKANNTDALSLASSWVGGVVPGSNDVAVFNSTLGASTAMFMDASRSLLGVKVVGNPDGLILDTFGPGATGPGTAAVLTLGSAGLDFSGATSGTTFSFDSPTISLTRGVRQSWSIADGAIAALRGPLTSNGGAISFSLGASNTGLFQAIGWTSPVSATSKMLNFAATVTKADGTMNFAAEDSTRNIVSAETLGTAVANPAETTAGTAVSLPSTAFPEGSYIDVTVSNANAANTAFNVNVTMNTSGLAGSVTGLRFAQPHATAATNWTIGYGTNGRFQPSNPFKILVTPGVGARDVIFANGSGAHEFRFNNGGAQLIFEQFNTQGNLYWRGDVSAASSSTTGSAIIKTGPGKVIFANPSFGAYATTYASITDGIFQMGESNASGSLGTIPITNNGTLRLQRSDAFTLANVISGGGGLVSAMSGTGNLTVTGANTFTGPVTLESGILTIGSSTALGTPSAVNLQAGSLVYGSGFTTDISAAPVTVSGAVSIDTGSNNVTYANSVGQAGVGSLTKKGSGTLTLGAANTYTGGTTVSTGVLSVTNTSGSATGVGAVSVAVGGTLAGTGTVSGNVTTAAGGKIAPGVAGVGTLTVGGLSLASSSLVDLDFASTSSYDKISVSGSNGLTINGGGLTLTSNGTATPWFTPGSYQVMQYAGNIQGTGASALSVLNPQAGYSYTFSSGTGVVTLTIVQDSVLTNWTSTSGGSWSSASNWSAGIPSGNYTAQFTTSLGAPATVTLDGSRSVNGLVFNSANGYTVAAGTGGSLTLSKGASNAAINVVTGNHVISAPVVLSSTLAASTDANTSLTISGAVSGAGGLIKTGAGTLDLTEHNSFTGAVSATGGVLGFAYSDSLGTGSISLSGATLRYDTGNTADISSKAFTVGQDGATIDTNGSNVIFANSIGNNGTGAFTKAGTGILALSSASTYTGNTTITGGSLLIEANDRLGSQSSSLILNGGTLAAGATFNLQTISDLTYNRSVVVGASGGSISVGNTFTLGVTGVISGTGTLTKTGSGTLSLSDVVSTKSGGFTLQDGVLNLGTDLSFGAGTAGFVGAGSLTLEGGTLTSANTANNTLSFSNPIVVPSGKTASITTPNRFTIAQPVSGAGTLNMSINTNVTRADFSADWSGFTGTLNLTGSGGIRLLNNGGSFNVAGLANAHVSLGTGLSFVAATNSGGNVFQVGALEGAGTLTNSNGGISNWQIGGRNESTTFSGSFVPGTSVNSVTKVGTGTLTLNGASLHAGLTTVNAGSLLIDSVIPTSTATAPTLPARSVTVATAGTLGGHGTITPDTVVNGVLRPDSTGTGGGQLTFGGILELISTATTQFDFSGAIYTGVKSTLSGGVTYGGALKVNYLGSIYNGSYTLFELTGSPTGAFSGVTVTTTATPAGVSLTDSSGTWSGTVDGANFSFNASTGVLTVTGGATAVTPDTPSGVTATAGNTQVSLGWNVAANAGSYIVKRGTVAGGPYTTLSSSVATTSYVDTGLTNGTTYYYVIQAKNGSGLTSGNSAEVSATPTVVVLTGLQTWRQQKFGTTDNTGNAADSADPDGDGIPNLLEYATGRDPLAASTPVLTLGSSAGSLTVTYTRIADPNLTYTVQGVNDVGGTPSWATVATSTGAANVAGPVTVTDTQTIASSTRRFLRLTVSYTP